MIWLYLLGAAGLTIILVMSKVCKPLREALPPPIGFRGLDSATTERPILLGCSLCTGTWVGAAVGAYAFIADLLPSWACRICNGLLFAFSVALVAYVFGTWLREHDRKH